MTLRTSGECLSGLRHSCSVRRNAGMLAQSFNTRRTKSFFVQWEIFYKTFSEYIKPLVHMSGLAFFPLFPSDNWQQSDLDDV